MPERVVPSDIPESEPNAAGGTLFQIVHGNGGLNSTINETFQIEEEHQPQTGITIRAWTVAPPTEIRTTNIRLNLKYYYKSPALLASLPSASILVTEPRVQEYPFVRSSGHPTTVLPSAISSNWNDLAGGGLSEKTYQRLLELAGLSAGWNGPGSLGMNASSLWSFIAFWKQVRQISRDPELVLTPSGYVQAEWRKNDRHYLEIDFRGAIENSYFALVDSRKTLIEGAAPLQEVLNIIKAHKNGSALTWHYEESE